MRDVSNSYIMCFWKTIIILFSYIFCYLKSFIVNFYRIYNLTLDLQIDLYLAINPTASFNYDINVIKRLAFDNVAYCRCQLYALNIRDINEIAEVTKIKI